MKAINSKNVSYRLKSILAIALGAFLTQSSALAGPAVNGDGVVYNTMLNPAWLADPSMGPPILETTPIDGATATIHRNHKGVTINIHTVGLNPHHVYTVWLAEIGVPGRAVFLTGHIVGASGEAGFSGRLGLNSAPDKPVHDPIGGEFHAILADHGPLDPSLLPEDIKTSVPPFSMVDGEMVLNWTQLVVFEP